MHIRWTSTAVEDCETIFNRIRQDSLRAATGTDLTIETQIDRLIDFPYSGRTGRIIGTRELVISRTPYIAAYMIDADTIVILRVIHGAQEWPRTMSREL